MKLRKLLLCLFLSVALTVTFIPNMAYAEGGDGTDEGDGWSYVTNGDDDGYVYLDDENQALLEVQVFDSDGNEVTNDDDLVSYQWEILDDYDEDEDNYTYAAIEGATGPTYIATEETEYRCYITYDGDSDYAYFEVIGSEEEDFDWYAEAVEEDVYLDEDGNATFQVIVYTYDDNGDYVEITTADYVWTVFDHINEGGGEVFVDIPGAENSPEYVATETGCYECAVTYNGEVQYVTFNALDPNEEEDWWYAEAVQSHVCINALGEAQLEVKAYDGDDQEITDDVASSIEWYAYDEDGDRGDEPVGTGSSYAATETGIYSCVVYYEDDDQEVFFRVLLPGQPVDWFIEADSTTVYLDEDGNAELYLNVIDKDYEDFGIEIDDAAFKWFKYDEDEKDYVEIEGETNRVLDVTETGSYRCEVSYSERSETVDFKVLPASEEPEWYAEAEEEEVYLSEEDGTALLTVYVYDKNDQILNGASYQWSKYDDEEDKYVAIDSATDSYFEASQAGLYQCEVYYGGDYQYVDFEVLESGEEETGWTIYTNANDDDEVYLDEDGEAYLEVSVYAYDDEGEDEVTDDATYQWSYYDEDEEKYIKIADATSYSYIASEEGEYRCKVTYNGETDDAYFYVVENEEMEDWFPQADYDEVELERGKALLEVVVYEYDEDEDEYFLVTGDIGYQWEKYVGYDEEEGKEIYELISGANESTYTATEVGTYRCQVTYNGDTKPVEIDVVKGLGWYVKALSDEVELKNGEAQLGVSVYTYDEDDNKVDITDASFQWEKCVGYDDEEEEDIYEPISGANKSTYTATSIGEYRCVVTYNDNSQNEYIYVWKQRDWTITTNADEDYGEVSLDKNGIAVLAVHVLDKDGIDVTSQAVFKWYYYDPDEEESQIIPTATTNTYTATKAGNYWCDVFYDDDAESVDFYVMGAFDDIPDEPETLILNKDKEVQITEPGQVVTFAFKAPADGTYFFESTGDQDTKGCVLDEDGVAISQSDDYDEDIMGYNFRAYFEAVKGKTYYLQAKLYNSNESEVSFVVHAKEDYYWFVISNANINEEVFLIGEKVALEAHAVIDTEDDLEYLDDDATYQWYRHFYDEDDDSVNILIEDATNPVYEATEEGTYMCIVTYEGNVEKAMIDVVKISEEDMAGAVADLIDDLPALDKLTLSDEWDVEYAKQRFDALTDEQKASISDELKTKLSNAVTKIHNMIVDKDLADDVAEVIKALPATDALTLNDKAKVDSAKAQYDELTDEQKSYISLTVRNTLNNAVARIKKLQDDKDAADAVATLIHALPAISDLTLDDEDSVNIAKTKFDALTDEQKALISDEYKTKLNNADNRIAKLKADYAAAQSVTDAIHALPATSELTLDDKDAVDAAKAKYDALTADQRNLVSFTDTETLDTAVARISKLLSDRARAADIEALIDEIRAVQDLTLEDKTAVESVLAQYEALTPDQKAFLSDAYKTLINDIAAKMASLVYDANVEKASNLTVSGLKVTSKKKKTAVVKWKANTEASGYVIQYSMKKNFKKAKVKTIKKADAKKAKIKKLKSKKYFFRIATYTNVKDPVNGNDVVVMGKWSKPKKIKIK